jgi:hypothetical protein
MSYATVPHSPSANTHQVLVEKKHGPAAIFISAVVGASGQRPCHREYSQRRATQKRLPYTALRGERAQGGTQKNIVTALGWHPRAHPQARPDQSTQRGRSAPSDRTTCPPTARRPTLCHHAKQAVLVGLCRRAALRARRRPADQPYATYGPAGRARAGHHSGGSVRVADEIAEAIGDSHVLYKSTYKGNVQTDAARLPLRKPAGAVREGCVNLCVRPRRGLSAASGAAEPEAHEMTVNLGAR